MVALASVEQSLFQRILADQCDCDARLEAIFLVGAPRTGSTVLYQAVCNRFGMPFVANLTNDLFASTPIIGFTIQKAAPIAIPFNSRFGKTEGAFQPSEGSALMRHWFGSGDPPALKAATVRAELEQHFVDTIRAVAVLFGSPLVFKNAWNCYRVPYLARTLPNAHFIWIRRDIGDAAKSDLDARYQTKGDPSLWNSALPPNIEKLRCLPPALQVVENQFAFNTALRDSLQCLDRERWMEVWYEDFQLDPESVLSRIGKLLDQLPRSGAPTIKLAPSNEWSLGSADIVAIDDYLYQWKSRFDEDRRHDRS